MSDLNKAIEELEKRLAEQQAEVKETKIAINSLLKILKQPPRYADLDDTPRVAGALQIPSDKWFGQALATAAREYLLLRRAANLGPATAEEIFEGLGQGGYLFDGKEGHQLRGMAISLGKNPIFIKLPNGRIGMRDWYPGAKDPTKKKKFEGNDSGGSEAGQDPEAAQ